MSFPFHYEFGAEHVEVKLGPFVARRIRYDDIEGARFGYPFWNEHWTNFWPMRFLTLRRRSGICRNFVINPGDREAFVAELRKRTAIPEVAR